METQQLLLKIIKEQSWDEQHPNATPEVELLGWKKSHTPFGKEIEHSILEHEEAFVNWWKHRYGNKKLRSLEVKRMIIYHGYYGAMGNEPLRTIDCVLVTDIIGEPLIKGLPVIPLPGDYKKKKSREN